MLRKDANVTIYDIAGKLGLAGSTVTRALSGQKGVSEATRELVRKTAEEMGYRKNVLAQGLKHKPIHIAVVLRETSREYQQMIMNGALDACDELTDYGVKGECFVIDRADFKRKMVAKVEELAELGYDAILFSPIRQNPQMDSLIEKVSAGGTSIGTLATPRHCPHAAVTVYANYRTSGRIAADLFALQGLQAGDEIAVIIGSRDEAIHQDNIRGFTEMNAELGFSVHIIEHQDNERIACLATEQLLTQIPNIRGIYSATAVTGPVCKKVTEMGMAGKVRMIATEMSETNAQYLMNGTLSAIIDQDPYQQGYQAVKSIYSHILGGRGQCRIVRVDPQIITRGNVASYRERIRQNRHDA